jgi:hypothetical protein
MKISNGSKNRCREKFQYKGIGKVINRACNLLENEDVEVIISECIYDTDDSMIYNVLLYLIRENCKSEKIIKELEDFLYL